MTLVESLKSDMEITSISKIFFLFLIVFSINSAASEPKLSCAQVFDLQPKILKLDQKYRSDSKEYLVHKRSSYGWVLETYLFIGEYDEKYIIAGIGNQALHKEIIITKAEFQSIQDKFISLIEDDKFTVSETDHNHCNQLIIKSNTQKYDITLEGLTNNLYFTKAVRELDYLIFLEG